MQKLDEAVVRRAGVAEIVRITLFVGITLPPSLYALFGDPDGQTVAAAMGVLLEVVASYCRGGLWSLRKSLMEACQVHWSVT